MQVSLKVSQLIFAERGMCLMVQHVQDGRYAYYGITEVFSNDALLSGFNFSDIRLICYFAFLQEFELDRMFLKKARRSKSFRKKMQWENSLSSPAQKLI